jgi:histidine triad (HIT) family protein
MTIFEKIIVREIPATIVYEDDQVIAFRDIDPKAPHHVVITTKRVIPGVNHVEPSDEPLLGHMVVIARKLAEDLGIAESGYRLVINSGPDAGQSVDHIHMHVLGGRPLEWPPG